MQGDVATGQQRGHAEGLHRRGRVHAHHVQPTLRKEGGAWEGWEGSVGVSGAGMGAVTGHAALFPVPANQCGGLGCRPPSANHPPSSPTGRTVTLSSRPRASKLAGASATAAAGPGAPGVSRAAGDTLLSAGASTSSAAAARATAINGRNARQPGVVAALAPQAAGARSADGQHRRGVPLRTERGPAAAWEAAPDSARMRHRPALRARATSIHAGAGCGADGARRAACFRAVAGRPRRPGGARPALQPPLSLNRSTAMPPWRRPRSAAHAAPLLDDFGRPRVPLALRAMRAAFRVTNIALALLGLATAGYAGVALARFHRLPCPPGQRAKSPWCVGGGGWTGLGSG